MPVKPIPDAYQCVAPYLIVDGAAAAIEFYKRAFGAVEHHRFSMPDGKIGHAEVRINGWPVMLADEFPQMNIKGPKSLGGTAVGLLLYVQDVDAAYQRALDAGATVMRPVQDQFYGDRSGCLFDPFGHQWTLATHKEDLSELELQRRFEEAMGEHSCG